MKPYPGPKSREALDELCQYVIATPFPFVMDLARSSGMYLATIDGQRVFDWAGFFGSHLLGYNHPRMRDPEYIDRLLRVANIKVANPDFLTLECLEYYRLVHSLAPKCMRNPALEVYAVNSGAEAVENMLKYMINLQHARKHGGTGDIMRRRFIFFDQAFHGRTVFALNVTRLTHAPVVTRGFLGFDEGNIQVPFPAVDTSLSEEENRATCRGALDTIQRILEVQAHDVVGIIVEPLQGAGGQRVALPEFYRGLSELAHRYDVFLGFDEVQTAGGQTGSFFAIDLFDLPYPPQAVATAKKLGCGVVYMLESMEDRGVLDSTWGGTLADMVRVVQEMRIVHDESLIEQVPGKAEHLVARLNEIAGRYPEILYNIRGLGLYQGFTLRTPSHKALLTEIALQQQNLLLLGAGTDAIRLRPPLDVTDADIDTFAAALDRSIAALVQEQ